MSPNDFVAKWKAVNQTERAVAQAFFLDLCDLLEEPKPQDADPSGTWYCFEKGATKTTGSDGWADVWKKGYFAWENKGKHKDLDKAFVQLQQYAVALENPPLLIVCDIERIRIVTNFNNEVSTTYELVLDDLLLNTKRQLLKDAFTNPEKLRTGVTRESLTQDIAKEFAGLALELEAGGHPPLKIAHFINRMVFCMFAEDTHILGDNLFQKMLQRSWTKSEEFQNNAAILFGAMATGGMVGFDPVHWFNGGLFDDAKALPLTDGQIKRVLKAAQNDWSQIEPSLFGTLFERGLDPKKRSQLGAHYTDAENILRVVDPVVLQPLREEWKEHLSKLSTESNPEVQKQILEEFHDRVANVRILDPACGSGNFLYMALKGLKDLEHELLTEYEKLFGDRPKQKVSPECVHGIEISPYAAELARVTVWIGEIQWQMEHGYDIHLNPILKPLDTIENRDALLNLDGTEATWPDADFIIGNPPFLGDKKMKEGLGIEYSDKLRKVFTGKVAGSADLVCYWFYKAGEALRKDLCKSFGLVSTNNIRKGANNNVLRSALTGNEIFQAWADLPWHDEKGAAVRVSIICIRKRGLSEAFVLNDEKVLGILPHLTPITILREVDLGESKVIAENVETTFNGICLAGNFDVPDSVAVKWLNDPNPHGRPNSDILRPLVNGKDISGNPTNRWIIDTGTSIAEKELCLYAAPYEWLLQEVKPVRETNNRKSRAERWWLAGETRPGMRKAIKDQSRFLVTPETAKYRYFVWLSAEEAPDHKLVVFKLFSDYFQGILESRVHKVWAETQGNRHSTSNSLVYTSKTTFLTFPFPEPTEAQREEISAAAKELDRLRENWLNPEEWTQENVLEFPATVGGPWHRWIPDAENLTPGSIATARYVRRVAHPATAKALAKRTLTNLYNERPAWLRHAHEALDNAVADAYGFAHDISDAEILSELLRLNLEIAARESENPES